MSVRLTKELREDIVGRVLRHKYDPIKEAAKAEETAIVAAIIEEVLPQSACDALASFHPEWKGTVSEFSVNGTTSGRSAYISVRSELKHTVPANFNTTLRLRGAKNKRAKQELLYDYSRWRTEGGEALTIKNAVVVEYVQRKLALLAERAELRAKLEALVNSVTTTKKLYEVWPELDEIVPNKWVARDALGTALTVSVTDLNKAIPLPVKKEKAA